uniref:Uncharacterized protein n=1 Tax=Anguilla anguilla TaxID=7936 RepID=A0A0E9R2V0_ANGAN
MCTVESQKLSINLRSNQIKMY